MGTITLPNVPATSDITSKVRLKYGGMPIDFRTLHDIRAWVYSDEQKALAGRCVTTIEGEDGEILSCLYTATKPQYLGPNRIIVQAKYHGQTNTYDKLAFNIVRRLDDVATEVVEVEDNDAEVAIEVDVTIEITEVSAGLLDRGIAAALDAADKAEHAASLVPLQVLQDCEQATEEANNAAEAAYEAAEHAPYIGENGNWWRWDSETRSYVDSGDVAQGPTGNGIQTVEQTQVSYESEGENVVTVTMTDGTQAQFSIRNGKRGVQGIPGAANAKYHQVESLPEASAETMDYIYLTPTQNAGVFDMSYTEYDEGVYTWKPMGTTAIQLSDYATKDELGEVQREINMQEYIPVSLTEDRNLRPTQQDVVTGNNDYSYYARVSSGDEIVINYSISQLYIRYAFTGQLPAAGVPCSGYGSSASYYNRVELTAPFDGYLLLAFDVVPSSVSVEVKNTGDGIGAVVREMGKTLPGVVSDLNNLQNGISKVVLESSELPLTGFVIDRTWKKYSGYDSVCIPVRKYNASHIKITTDKDTLIALLKDFPFSDYQVNSSVEYAEGQSDMIPVEKDTPAEYDFPDNAGVEYVYLYVKNAGATINAHIELSVGKLYRETVVDIWTPDAKGVIIGNQFQTAFGYDSINIPVEGLRIYKVTANAYQDTFLSFLKTTPVPGSAVEFADQTTADEIYVKAGTERFIQIPKDAAVINFPTYNKDLSLLKTRRPLEITDVTELRSGYAHPRHIVYVAASDSCDEDKACADFICSGTADDGVIQKAVDFVSQGAFNAKAGEVVLFAGNYDINFRGNATAIKLPSVGTAYDDIDLNTTNVTIRGFTHNADNVNLNVSQSTYDSLSSGIEYAVIGSELSRTNYSHHSIQNLHINIPSATKKIVCIDGSHMAATECIDIICRVLDCGGYNRVGSYIPNFDCIGIRGNFGGNNMRHYEWKNCICYGFGQGLAVGGEHLFMIKCAGLFCKYGFTFNSYRSSALVSNHPITIINCGDEANFNLPKFCTLYDWRTQEPRGEMGQAIVFINFSLELHSDWLSVEGQGKRMEEETPGQYYGMLSYTTWSNARIFEPGSGLNFETNNMQCKKIGNSAYRNSANFPQLAQYFDTTLNKLLVLIDRDNKTWVDALGNPV